MNTPKQPGTAGLSAIHHLVCSALCAALLLGSPAQAQTIYRIVGSDGRVTFSDKMPTTGESATVLAPGGKSQGAPAATLPSELREVAGKYPVTLYTATNCAPCNSGRELLGNRGIPFAEKTIATSEDSEALQRISGSSSLPLLTIGAQQIKGFSESEWTQFLDAAGYPKTSALPATYRAAPATPLVFVEKAVPAARPDAAQSPKTQPEPGPTPDNPAGIKF